MIRSFRFACLAAAIALLAPLSAALSQQIDVIRGKVTSADGKPIENANVTATSVSGNVNRTARTDRNGRFTITFPGGDGDYFVDVRRDRLRARAGFEVKRTADQEILVADARLLPAAGHARHGEGERAARSTATATTTLPI